LGKASRKYYRTILLGVAAMACLLWAAVDQFGVPWTEILDLMLATLLLAGMIILLAALVVGLWVGLRRLLRRD
jgi:peptidoglycan biosynthesis protein MviN/MurJ (putative lipid II flippase)